MTAHNTIQLIVLDPHPISEVNASYSIYEIVAGILRNSRLLNTFGICVFEVRPEDYLGTLRETEGAIVFSHWLQRLFPGDETVLLRQGHKLVVWYDDLHDRTMRERFSCFFPIASRILVPDSLWFAKYELGASWHRKAVTYPYHFPETFLPKTTWLLRKKKLLISGAISPLYPARADVLRYHKEHPEDQRIDWLPHPGHRQGSRAHCVVGLEYLRYLSGYRLALATAARSPLDFLLSKFIEIPGCGCTPVFAPIESLKLLGFEAWVNYVPYSQPELKELLALVDSREGLNIAEAAVELVRTRHLTPVRLEKQLIPLILEVAAER